MVEAYCVVARQRRHRTIRTAIGMGDVPLLVAQGLKINAAPKAISAKPAAWF